VGESVALLTIYCTSECILNRKLDSMLLQNQSGGEICAGMCGEKKESAFLDRKRETSRCKRGENNQTEGICLRLSIVDRSEHCYCL